MKLASKIENILFLAIGHKFATDYTMMDCSISKIRELDIKPGKSREFCRIIRPKVYYTIM